MSKFGKQAVNSARVFAPKPEPRCQSWTLSIFSCLFPLCLQPHNKSKQNYQRRPRIRCLNAGCAKKESFEVYGAFRRKCHRWNQNKIYLPPPPLPTITRALMPSDLSCSSHCYTFVQHSCPFSSVLWKCVSRCGFGASKDECVTGGRKPAGGVWASVLWVTLMTSRYCSSVAASYE